MSHLSEGQLHGWLDGAYSGSAEEAAIRTHLAFCPECSGNLEAARALRDAATGVLDVAVPSGTAPPFAEIVRRAEEPEWGDPSGNRREKLTRPRARWLSIERLGWAATVALALGAGWMGRALLVERGWQDPFHEGRQTALVPVVESKREEGLRPEAERPEDADHAVGKAESENAAPEGVQGRDEVLARKAAAPPDAPVSEFGAVGQRLDIQEEAEGEAAPGPERQAGEVGVPVADETPQENRAAKEAVAPAGAAMMSRAPGTHEAAESWHEMPAPAASGLPPDAVGCYRLEYSWSPAVGYLPGRLRLTDRSAPERPGTPALAVTIPGEAVAQLRQAVWIALASDSVWIQLVTEPEGDTLTARLARADADWAGEGRVRSRSGRAGENRGLLRLSRVPCEVR